jgi:hypothetical protein
VTVTERRCRQLLAESIDYVLGSADTEFLANTLELAAAAAAHLEEGLRAARIAGAAEGVWQRTGMPAPAPDAAMMERFLAPARAAVAPQKWDGEFSAGRALGQRQAAALLREAAAPAGPATAAATGMG